MNEWLRGGVTSEQVVERLRRLLALPVEVVLPAHGSPTDRAALERALSSRLTSIPSPGPELANFLEQNQSATVRSA